MPKPLVFHPVLFSLFPVLFLYSHNINQLPLREILVPLGICAGISVPLTVILNVLPWRQKGAALVSIALICFFSYCHFFNAVASCLGGGPAIEKCRWPLVAWFLLFGAAAAAVVITKRRIEKLTAFLNTASLALVLMALLTSGWYCLMIRRGGFSARQAIETEPLAATRTPASLPDIYFLVFDRYASAPVLREVYGFDNGEFMGFLQDRGFHVVEKGRANYLKTAHSLAATLNLTFLDGLAEKMGPASNDWLPLHAMIEDNRVWRFLKKRGYRFLYFGSWWQPTSMNRHADMNFNICPAREFEMLLYRSTILYPITSEDDSVKQFLNYKDRRLHHDRILYQFAKLAEVPAMSGPTFVFAHMLIPHDPYVFDSCGTFLPKETAWSRSTERNYLDQCIFTNKKIRELVDVVLARSAVEPIIIIQADEGPFPRRYKADEDGFPWLKATPEELHQKLGILNALYLPGVPPEEYGGILSPVNTFRLVFNHYFGTGLRYLPDRSFIFEDGRHPYTFHEVTAMAGP